MRLVFMGTPDIAATSLRALLATKAGHEVVGVFTREDKPVGRKQTLTPPPVKILAQENGIPIYQPKSLRTPEALQVLQQWKPDVVVVVAYGRILPPEMLALPALGCINLHVSLLPKYRGAAPIQWAVIKGETQTGVTVMQMDEGVDTGPVLAQQRVAIGANQTAGEVFEEVAHIGAQLLCSTIANLQTGRPVFQAQQGEPSLAPMLTKTDAEMDFALEAGQLHNLVRGCNPWPLAWFVQAGKRIKVLNATVALQQGKKGEILQTSPLTIACGQNAIVLEHVVPEGARPMTGAEWAAGRRFTAGQQLFTELEG